MILAILFYIFLFLALTHVALRLVAFVRGPRYPRLPLPRPLWTDAAILDPFLINDLVSSTNTSPKYLENDSGSVKGAKGLRIALTGGSGFLGRYLCRRLVELGHSVLVLDVVPPKPELLAELNTKYGSGKIEYYKVNLADPSEQNELYISRLLLRVDALIHAAGVVNMAISARNLLHNVHVVGTAVMVNCALRAKVRNFAYVSSAAVMFSKSKDSGQVDEGTPFPPDPLTYYGVTKCKAEEIILSAYKSHGSPNSPNPFRPVIIRPPGMYGFDDAMIAEKLLYRNFPGSPPASKQCWVYVKNAVHALTLAVEKLAGNTPNVAGEVFYISDEGPLVDLPVFWNRFLQIEGKGHVLKVIPYGVSLVGALFSEFLSWYLCDLVNLELFQFHRETLVQIMREGHFKLDKAKRFLGYQPPYTSEEAFREMLSDHEKRLKDSKS